RFPIIGTVAGNLPPVLLGVARKAIDEVSVLAQAKVPVARSAPLRERASAQANLARAEAGLGPGRVFLFDPIKHGWEAPGRRRGYLAETEGRPIARHDSRGKQCGGSGRVDVQGCGYERDIYEKSLGALFPRCAGPAASRVWRRDAL